MLLPLITFTYIKAGTGKTGTSGDGLEDAWSTNFKQITSLFNTLDAEVEKRIISNDIKAIKVEDNIAYFTTDNENWISLGPSFENITGSPLDNEALKEELSKYATVISFNALSKRVTDTESDIVTLDNALTIAQSDITAIQKLLNDADDGVLVRLVNLEKSNAKKISSPTVTAIKEREQGLLEYTIDGENWYPVSSSIGVEWGDILGDIANQADLINKFDTLQDQINSIVAGEGADHETLENHLVADNPHNISAQTIGLENVDNTSDENKPVSTFQQEAINAAIGGLNIKALNASQYEALTDKDTNTLYIITDKNN